VQGIHVELADLRRLMLQEMSAKNSDTIKLNQLSDSIGLLHAKLKRLTYRYYLDMKDISTPEQQEKLEILFSGIFTRDIQMGRYGRGGPPAGRRQGRRINN
jgi:Spy/CpxP family protein refolding chaperone